MVFETDGPHEDFQENRALAGESVLSLRGVFPNRTSFNAPSATVDASSCCTVTAPFYSVS